MIAVIFEVTITPGMTEQYLDFAAQLRPQLAEIDGFISIERFQSLSNEGKVLSLSFWRDEEAIAQWRRVEAHRLAQMSARERVFQDYRLRVAGVIRDYGMNQRDEAPAGNPFN
ncbi:antibiotic biosynthesis monooxygenase [Vibrio sp. SM6]|uniref:Antibiotic biosynthesis monooxygenase n=1 Tax=Vibrio agarilyticus TaxID=2726741 RepID=A0A7X8TQQ5_9VIBR|nr:antibiotic biosynthesis monooxygenase [Vibrio agarilyticus]NLS13086.1 antibiotic biosynthesis monooxygenase [Vibrio agarilyticus]